MAGTVFGLAFFAPLIVWLVNLGVGPWLALTAVQALILGLTATALPRPLTLPGWPLFAAAWWVAVEALRGRAPLGGFLWGRLAFSQSDAPYAAWAAVGGAPLLTFVVALLRTLALYVVTAVRGRRHQAVADTRGVRRRVFAGVCAGAVALVAVPTVLPDPTPAKRSAVVAVVHGNVPRTRSLANVVLWPENSLDSDPALDPALGSVVADTVRTIGRPLLIGAILRGPGDTSHNAGQLWLPGQGPVDFYAKRQLVPFGEDIPARSLLGGLGSLQLIPRDFTPGTSQKPLRAGQTRIGDVICCEIAYDGRVRDTVRAGANLLVVQTNNATYERGVQAGQSDQQLAMARLRAIEYGRAVAMASTSGVSAIVAPDGRITDRVGTWRSASLVRRVPLAGGRTVAERVGAWPKALLSGSAVAARAPAAIR